MSNNKKIILLVLPALLLALSFVGLAFADNGKPASSSTGMMRDGGRSDLSTSSRHFSSTTHRFATSTEDDRLFGTSTMYRFDENSTTTIDRSGRIVINGTVSAINGLTLSVVDKMGTVYSVNVASTTFKKDKGENTMLANVKVSDKVIVQGIASSTATTTVKAVRIVDITLSQNGNATSTQPEKSEGFFSRIINFFRGWFGRR